MVRESSGEPNRLSFAKNFQVVEAQPEFDISSAVCLTNRARFAADHPRKEGARDRVLPEGVCAEDGPAVNTWAVFSEDKSTGATWYFPCVCGPVLAFDIETTGLSDRDTVTCVCAFDPDRGIKFGRCTPEGAVCNEFLLLLDQAPLLCAFNGVRFDVPFLAKRWGVSGERAGAWVRKLVDPFEACRMGLRRTFSLDRLLEANGLDCKTGSGLEAVAMARDGRWVELEAYCMSDTEKTHSVVKMTKLLLPDAKKKSL